jgi:DNA-binding response OmpR family regulator
MSVDAPDAAPPPTSAATPLGRIRLGVIDQESASVQVLSNRLPGVGWTLQVFETPVGVRSLVSHRLNALAIDFDLVGPDPWDYLERVCEAMPGLTVLVCSSRSTVADRVRAFRLGADAWLQKPWNAEELISLVQVGVRRQRRERAVDAEQLTVGQITIRPHLFQAFVGETSLELTSREFELLSLLSRTDGVLRREDIYLQVWGYQMMHGDRSVDVFIKKLRYKLRLASPGWVYIHTHFGVGYRFAPHRHSIAA